MSVLIGTVVAVNIDSLAIVWSLTVNYLNRL